LCLLLHLRCAYLTVVTVLTNVEQEAWLRTSGNVTTAVVLTLHNSFPNVVRHAMPEETPALVITNE
jgi:hypothetical protein